MAIDLLIVAAILAIQPLLAVLYVYAAVRLFTRFASRESGRWMDARIDKAKDAASDLRDGDTE